MIDLVADSGCTDSRLKSLLDGYLPALQQGLSHLSDIGGDTQFVVGVVGAGGSGVVFSLGAQAQTGAAYCLKILRIERASEQGTVTGFRREAELLAELAANDAGPPLIQIDGRNSVDVTLNGKTLPAFLTLRGISLARLLKTSKPRDGADKWEMGFHQNFWTAHGAPGKRTMGRHLQQLLIELDKSLRILHEKSWATAGDAPRFTSM